MTRMRVHELAKKLNLNNKDLIDRILKLGIQVKNHMSTLTESTVQKVRQQFAEAKAETVEKDANRQSRHSAAQAAVGRRTGYGRTS